MPRPIGAAPATRRAALGLTLATPGAPRLADAQQRREPGAVGAGPAPAGAPAITSKWRSSHRCRLRT